VIVGVGLNLGFGLSPNVLDWLRSCCAPRCDRRRGLEVGMLHGDQMLGGGRLVVQYLVGATESKRKVYGKGDWFGRMA
jgi:hypothetical protein